MDITDHNDAETNDQNHPTRQTATQPKQEDDTESNGNLTVNSVNKEYCGQMSGDKVEPNASRTVPQAKHGSVKERKKPAPKEDQATVLTEVTAITATLATTDEENS